MRKLIILLMFGFGSGNVVADVIMSKQSFIEAIEGSLENTVCTKTYNTCLGATKTSCSVEVKKIFKEECSNDIPDGFKDLDEVRAYAKSTAMCSAKKYVENHNVALKKNKGVAACQSIIN
jgi:hypothetical protein